MGVMLAPRSLFVSSSISAGGEVFETLLERPGLRMEQIHSRGQGSPPDFWYDQDQDEWVLLAQGWAVLEVEDQGRVDLTAGDYVLIPRRIRHRVAETSDDAVWLAIHC